MRGLERQSSQTESKSFQISWAISRKNHSRTRYRDAHLPLPTSYLPKWASNNSIVEPQAPLKSTPFRRNFQSPCLLHVRIFLCPQADLVQRNEEIRWPPRSLAHRRLDRSQKHTPLDEIGQVLTESDCATDCCAGHPAKGLGRDPNNSD